MKKASLFTVILALVVLHGWQHLQAQICATCPGNTVTGLKASAFGDGNKASGNYSFIAGRNSTVEVDNFYSNIIGSWSTVTGSHANVIGSFSEATFDFAYAFGAYLKARGSLAFAIGAHAEALSSGSFVMGKGAPDAKLINNIPNSLMVGFNSTQPTLFVGDSPWNNRTGRIGIGNVTSPQAKLHIRADAGEPATLRLEATGTTGDNIFSRILFTNNHTIQAANNQNFTFTTQNNNHFIFQNGSVGINNPNPLFNLDVNGSARVSSLMINNYTLPGAQGQITEFLRGDGRWAPIEINMPWLNNGNHIYNSNPGSVVVGSQNPLTISGSAALFAGKVPKLEIITGTSHNENYEELITIRHPNVGEPPRTRRLGIIMKLSSESSTEHLKMGGLVLDSENSWANSPALHLVTANAKRLTVTYTGNVGIGTTNPKGKLNVVGNVMIDGNLYVEEVIVEEAANWPDYVFDDDYELMSLSELKDFVKQNRHLPGMPKADESGSVKNLELSQLNAQLLKKIEELTLYILEQEERITILERQLE